jgi:hypothetical protein
MSILILPWIKFSHVAESTELLSLMAINTADDRSEKYETFDR